MLGARIRAPDVICFVSRDIGQGSCWQLPVEGDHEGGLMVGVVLQGKPVREVKLQMHKQMHNAKGRLAEAG